MKEEDNPFIGTADEITDTQCNYCNNFIKDLECKAFKKIPDEIIFNEHDHRKPFPGDNGVLINPDERYNPNKIRFK